MNTQNTVRNPTIDTASSSIDTKTEVLEQVAGHRVMYSLIRATVHREDAPPTPLSDGEQLLSQIRDIIRTSVDSLRIELKNHVNERIDAAHVNRESQVPDTPSSFACGQPFESPASVPPVGEDGGGSRDPGTRESGELGITRRGADCTRIRRKKYIARTFRKDVPRRRVIRASRF